MKRNLEWWDLFQVPNQERKNATEFLCANAPGIEEHDYVLSTDGSGHKSGIGAYGGVFMKVIPEGDLKASVVPFFGGNYGSTTARNELSAMLEGLYRILDTAVQESHMRGEYETGTPRKEFVNKFTGDGRIRVLWYTDRKDLACKMIYGEDQMLLASRHTDCDLWARYQYFHKFFCITPIHKPRNTVKTQEFADALCTYAREPIKRMVERLKEENPDSLSIPENINQKALF